jgi:hypothetical protein
MRTTLFALALSSALPLAGGCGHHFELQAPDDFVELAQGDEARRGYALRATTADGVVIAVREIDNERHGTRDFWVAAIRNRLRREGGYALLEEREVRAASGDAGRQLRLGRDESGRPYAYWVTVFVRRDRITVVEAGGRRDTFDAQSAALERTIAGLRIR